MLSLVNHCNDGSSVNSPMVVTVLLDMFKALISGTGESTNTNIVCSSSAARMATMSSGGATKF